jgi:hypothetical protein
MTIHEIDLVTEKPMLFGDKTSQKWLKGVLEQFICTITFTKKDGTERVMKCTLSNEYLPPVQREITENTTTKEKASESLAVYDVEAQGWRAFRYDSIKKFEMTL